MLTAIAMQHFSVVSTATPIGTVVKTERYSRPILGSLSLGILRRGRSNVSTSSRASRDFQGNHSIVFDYCILWIYLIIPFYHIHQLMYYVCSHSDEERVYALEFPDLPGAVSEELGPHCSAALALVKQFSYVLTLEKCVVDEAESFRTAVLQLCDCRAFSVEAQYRPVCRTFILPDISCMYQCLYSS